MVSRSRPDDWPDFTDGFVVMPRVRGPSPPHQTATEIRMAQDAAEAKWRKTFEDAFYREKEKLKMPLPPEDQGKPGDPPNLGLLIKLLKMTTSSNDAEALSAIRKANEQLVKFGNDWEPLLRGKVTVIGDPFLNAALNPNSGKRTPPPPSASSSAPPPSPPPSAFRRHTPAPAPPPPKPKMVPNKFGGYCHHCNNYVPDGCGTVTLTSQKWILACQSCHISPSVQRSTKRAATPLDNL